MEKNNKKTLLSEFNQKIVRVPIDITDALLKLSNDEDERNVINSFAPTLVNQFKELSVFIEDHSKKATRQGIADVEQFLRISSANSLVDNLRLSLPSIGSVVGKLGIDGIVKEIKKIIKFILGFFGVLLPPWVDELLLLIDQILKAILGGGSIKMMNALSQAEQNYLSELTHLAKLKNATKIQYNEVQDDES